MCITHYLFLFIELIVKTNIVKNFKFIYVNKNFVANLNRFGMIWFFPKVIWFDLLPTLGETYKLVLFHLIYKRNQTNQVASLVSTSKLSNNLLLAHLSC